MLVSGTHGIANVRDLQILVEIDKFLALRMFENRPGEIVVRVCRFGLTCDGASQFERAGQPVDRKRGGPVIVAKPRACLAGQLVGGHGADRHAHEVAADGFADTFQSPRSGNAAHVDSAHVVFAVRLIQRMAMQNFDARRGYFDGPFVIRRPAPELHNGGHLNIRVKQIECHAVSVVIVGEYDGATSGPDAIELDQALRCRTHHHSGEIVVTKQGRLVQRPRGQHDAPGTQFIKALAADYREPVIRIPAVYHGGLHHLDVCCCIQISQQLLSPPRLRGRVDRAARIVQGAAEQRVFVDKQHVGAAVGRLDCRAQTGRARADDCDVAKAVLLVKALWPVRLVDDAETGLVPKIAEPQVPDATRPEERMVVEAGRQKTGEFLDPGVAVRVQRAAVVLSRDDEPVAERHAIGERVRICRQLYQRIGVLPRHGQHAARAVVLERPAQQPFAVGCERARNGIAGHTGELPALELEGNELLPIEHRSPRRRQAIGLAHFVTFAVSS